MEARETHRPETGRWAGPLLALLAAASFALSVPLGKQLLADASPQWLAALLYLGAGTALALWRAADPKSDPPRAREPLEAVSVRQGRLGAGRGDLPWLGLSVLAGGVVAPVLLLWGLQSSPASTASLLLSFEAVLTALWAASLFGEHVGARTWAAAVAVTAGALVLVSTAGGGGRLAGGSIAVVAACALWGLDNNLTRNICSLRPVTVAQVKGLGAGSVNLMLALAVGSPVPGGWTVLLGLLLGGVSYGVSLVLFVAALRRLGSARTAAYFGAAPLLAAALALAMEAERPGLRFLIATAAMASGALLMVSEEHSHEHHHGTAVHTHRHVPDVEHRHGH